MRLSTIATCEWIILVQSCEILTTQLGSLNQWALDLVGNKARILEAISRAKILHARLLITPELSICGYSCLDAFTEDDLTSECAECLAEVLADERSHGILVDVGLPVIHRSVRYNCRVVFYSGKILLIRPKQSLANDGNFREARYFTPWQRPQEWDWHDLPDSLKEVTGQTKVEFGEAVVQTRDVTIGIESCEELFTPRSPHTDMGLAGVEIFTNSSGSHHELRKLDKRMELIMEATRKTKGVYLYSNQIGNGGDRMNFDGCSCIVQNGKLLAQGAQFSLEDEVDVVVATVDLDAVQGARFAPSHSAQAARAPTYHRIELDIKLCHEHDQLLTQKIRRTVEREVAYYKPEEEIALGPAIWIYDYLRRSRQSGFFLPLSGGIDSCATALIVFSMCRILDSAVKKEKATVIADLRQISGDPDWHPESAEDICSRIMHTAFLGTTNSSTETRSRAQRLADQLSTWHLSFSIDSIITAFTTTLHTVLSLTLRYNTQGGTTIESLALQNIQSRTRMVLAYLLAAILPSYRQGKGDRKRSGGLLVLGSANVDEQLRGYFTKYDNSSADLNPIGGISKEDLRSFIAWARHEFDLPVLSEFLEATPSAELIPFTSDSDAGVQSDEAEMGITYSELSTFGRLRKTFRMGPYSQFMELWQRWGDRMKPREIFEKVLHFNTYFGINRHKMSIVTPSVHCCDYSPEDNRFDLRQILYPKLEWSYRKILRDVDKLEAAERGKKDD